VAHLNSGSLAAKVGDALALPIVGRQIGNSGSVELRIAGLDRPEGFSLTVTLGLQVAFAELHWDTFSRPLIAAIARRPSTIWSQVSVARIAIQAAGISTDLEVNRVRKAVEDDAAPVDESVYEIALSAQALSDHMTGSERAVEAATVVLALLVGMLPLDIRSNDASFEAGGPDSGEYEIEGAHSHKLRSHYERSRANRAIAILLHGTECDVCGFDFAATYGSIGDGFIEVHHLTPVSLLDRPRAIDPATELRPLCSNCHRMVHRQSPPFTPEELRLRLTKQNC